MVFAHETPPDGAKYQGTDGDNPKLNRICDPAKIIIVHSGDKPDNG